MATLPTVSIDEASPAGSDALNLGDNKIREFKTQNRELMEVDHVYPSAGQSATGGYHKAVHLTAAADIGTGAAGLPIIGAQTVAAKGELVYTDVDNNDVQITSVGKLCTTSLTTVASISTILNLIYPIGFVVTLGVATNPNTLFGIGTWTAIAGQVIVGKAGAGTFNTLDATGGVESVTLTSVQSGLPAHIHGQQKNGSDGTVAGNFSAGTNAANTTAATGCDTLANTAADAASSHTNLQPYIVKYCWQRTA